MNRIHLAIVVTGAAALSTSMLAQGLPTQKMLTIDVAQAIAQETMMKCRADGYKVTVTVVDSANNLKAFLRDDGAGMATVEVGRMKARSSTMIQSMVLPDRLQWAAWIQRLLRSSTMP